MEDKDKNSLNRSGINVDPIIKKNVIFLILSMLPYLFVQVISLLDCCVIVRSLHSLVVVLQGMEKSVIPTLLFGLLCVVLSYP